MDNLMDISDWLPTLFEAGGKIRSPVRQEYVPYLGKDVMMVLYIFFLKEEMCQL